MTHAATQCPPRGRNTVARPRGSSGIRGGALCKPCARSAGRRPTASSAHWRARECHRQETEFRRDARPIPLLGTRTPSAPRPRAGGARGLAAREPAIHAIPCRGAGSGAGGPVSCISLARSIRLCHRRQARKARTHGRFRRRSRRHPPLERLDLREPRATAARSRGPGPADLLPAALASAAAASRRATICANGTTGAIEAVVGTGAELDVELGYYHDRTPRGAAGCVRDAGLLAGSGTLVVADGTAIPTVDLAGRALRAPRVRRGGDGGRPPRRVAVRPPTPAGIYVFERRVLDRGLGERLPGHQGEPDPAAPPRGRARRGARGAAFCPHVFNAQTYLAVNQWMLERLARDDRSGDALVHPTAIVERGRASWGRCSSVPAPACRPGRRSSGPPASARDRWWATTPWSRGRCSGAAARSATGRSCTAAWSAHGRDRAQAARRGCNVVTPPRLAPSPDVRGHGGPASRPPSASSPVSMGLA